MDHTFSLANISAILLNTSDDVLMNAARYQARVFQSRLSAALEGASVTQDLLNFSLILAHVSETTGFPFYVPDPLAHPETVGQVWDSYLAGDTSLWERLVRAIDAPLTTAAQIHDKLPQATEEMKALSEHSASPFNRTTNKKR